MNLICLGTASLVNCSKLWNISLGETLGKLTDTENLQSFVYMYDKKILSLYNFCDGLAPIWGGRNATESEWIIEN